MNNAKKKKPLRRAKHWGARVWPMAGRMAVILVAVAVMGLMFSALQAVSSIVLRDIISLAILSGILLMMYSEGVTRGVADAAAQVRVLQRKGIRVSAVFMGEDRSAADAARIYGKNMARIRGMDQLARAAGRLIQNEIRELRD